MMTWQPPVMDGYDLARPDGVREAFDALIESFTRYGQEADRKYAKSDQMIATVEGVTDTIENFLKKNSLRSGMIVMAYTDWGTAKSWASYGLYVCDGTNGTPPCSALGGSQRFPLSVTYGTDPWTASKTAKTGGSAAHGHSLSVYVDTGGTHSHTFSDPPDGNHSHTIDESCGSHTHDADTFTDTHGHTVDLTASSSDCVANVSCSPANVAVANSQHTHSVRGTTATTTTPHSHAITGGVHGHPLSGEGTHGHTVSGGGHAHTTCTSLSTTTSVPPYFEIIYLMKG